MSSSSGSIVGTNNQIDVTTASNTSAIAIDPTYTSNIKANTNITGGGTITYTSAYAFSWTSRFIVMNDGKNANFATSGYFDISMPANGTVIPAYGGATAITVAGGTITLPAWQALYYILPVGNSHTSESANFAVVGYTGANYTVPENWVMIAIHNGDDNTIRLGTGNMMAPGQTIVTTYGQPSRYHIINENYGAQNITIGPTIGVDDGFTIFGSITNTVCASPNATTVQIAYNNGLLFLTTTSGGVSGITGNGTNTLSFTHSDGGCGYSNVLTVTCASGQINIYSTTNNGYFRYRFVWTY